MNNILNIASYRFVALADEQIKLWLNDFKQQALELDLRGTILLSLEGINLFLSGEVDQIRAFQNDLIRIPQFNSLVFRESWSDSRPFKKLRVRRKKEIISMGQANIQPESGRAPAIEPKVLRDWIRDQKPFILLDTRNQYEIDYGAFDQAVNLGLNNFRGFPEASKNLSSSAKSLPIVTYCTGGIRCEKAALWLKKQGYPEVYQLEGGILNYFSECGRDHFHGQCFVFDERAAVDETAISTE